MSFQGVHVSQCASSGKDASASRNVQHCGPTQNRLHGALHDCSRTESAPGSLAYAAASITPQKSSKANFGLQGANLELPHRMRGEDAPTASGDAEVVPVAPALTAVRDDFVCCAGEGRPASWRIANWRTRHRPSIARIRSIRRPGITPRC